MDGCNATMDVQIQDSTPQTEVVSEPTDIWWYEWIYVEETTYTEWYY